MGATSSSTTASMRMAKNRPSGGNVVRHNASYGLHLYPSISKSVIANNLVYEQVRRRGIIVSCPEGGGKNVIVNNTVMEDYGITIWNGDGEIVANNIVVSENAPLSLNENTSNVLVDYNLFVPESDRQGAHGITGDPMFVDAGKGVFWLREGSPAIGSGSTEHAPPLDFWGRDKSKDLGALSFVPFFASEQARDGWDYGWAYHRHSAKMMPDFWELPSKSDKE